MNHNLPIRIYVADGNEHFRNLLKQYMSRVADYTVITFSSGNELLMDLNSAPDIITMEYSLPDFQGEDLLIKIREILPNVPVLVISDQPGVKTAVNLIRKGANDYITKDDETQYHLLSALRKIVSSSDFRNNAMDPAGSTSSIDAMTSEETTLEEYNMRIIRHFLEKNHFNVVETAKKLEVGKSTIYRYLKENKIRLPEKQIS